MAKLSKAERQHRENLTWKRELDELFKRWQALPWDLQAPVLASVIGGMSASSKKELGPVPKFLARGIEYMEQHAASRPVPCPLCQDVPGKDGLGRPCKGCEGNGMVAPARALELKSS